jgi:hypothetical protein
MNGCRVSAPLGENPSLFASSRNRGGFALRRQGLDAVARIAGIRDSANRLWMANAREIIVAWVMPSLLKCGRLEIPILTLRAMQTS